MINKLCFMLLLMPFSLAQAVVIKVNAEYTQSTNNSMGYEFRITDPCTALPLSSFCDDVSRVIAVDADIDKPIFLGGLFKWDRFFYHSFPSERNVQLINESGSVANLGFRLTHTGYTIDRAYINVGSAHVADGGSDCSLIDANVTDGIKTVFYAINSSAQKKGGLCYSRPYNTALLPTKGIITKFYLGYKLVPVNLGGIPNGIYKGRLVLTVGSTRDIDFTNATYRSPSIVEIDMTLVVRSQLKVVFPNSHSVISLTPRNGWGNGAALSPLAANIPVKIMSDTPFWIGLMCQHMSGDSRQCEIRSADHAVPVSVYRKNHEGIFLLSPNEKKVFLNSRESVYDTFYFEIEKQYVKDMFGSADSKYKGDITIVIDAKMPVGF
ncbi:hypothetical protein [Aeromonas salmonicida]|uniref:hypothetical protein n=1 Tax=Aeromonas salmonicida TaxID=645 RepID=UPI00223EE3B5|nr:hypothetical protein [Aeromonas salmonicida]